MFKKITGLFALVLFTTLFSCSSDSEGENTLGNGSISATIDGQAWESINGGAIASVTNANFEGDGQLMLQIIAMKADQSTLTMQFPINNLSTGTYTFTENSLSLLSYVSSFNEMDMFSSDGENGTFTITLTEVNTETNTLSGTFSGTLVDFMGTQSIEITNGVIHNVTFGNTDLYSNGSMNLTNNGNLITMTGDSEVGTSLWIHESSLTNSIMITGTSLALDNNFGIYGIVMPKDATPGTYSLTSNEGYSAVFSNSNQQYNTTQGSITIVSHVGNTIVATFNFTAALNGNTANITNGQLTFEHQN